jgi:hypothetical protein
MPNRRNVVPPAPAAGCAAVIVSTRPNPGRRAVGATTTGAGAVTTGAGVTTTGVGAGATGLDVVHAASTVTAASNKGK